MSDEESTATSDSTVHGSTGQTSRNAVRVERSSDLERAASSLASAAAASSLSASREAFDKLSNEVGKSVASVFEALESGPSGFEHAQRIADLTDIEPFDVEPATLENDPAFTRLLAVVEKQSDAFREYVRRSDESEKRAWKYSRASLVVAICSLVVTAASLAVAVLALFF